MAKDSENQKELKLNLGCGKFPMRGFINCDIQKYPGVDKVMECDNLQAFFDNSVDVIYAHSFFEHLYIAQQKGFLDHCFRVLKKEGILIILGIPNFEEIARCYLEKRPGIEPFGGIFNLYQAYRLTHGECESDEGVSIPQMHKTIFDKDSLNNLFSSSDFPHYRICQYKFQKEQYPLTLGVVANKSLDIQNVKLRSILSPFDSLITDLEY